MAKRLELPKFQAFDSNGDPLSGGKVYTYEAGTSTEKASYTTSAGDVENANPVILDSRGEANIYLKGAYKINILDSDDSQITGWPVDNVEGGLGEAAMDDYYYPDATAADQGVTGDSDTITYAVDTISTDNGAIYLRHNGGTATTTYTLTTSEDIGNINLIIENGAIIDGAGTLTLDDPAQITAGKRKKIFGSSLTVTFTNGGDAPPEWWGENTTPGTTDMTTEMQSAIDAFGTNKHTIELADGQTYLTSGTIYFGNTTLIGNNSTIHILNNASFSQNGAATRNTYGAFLTKSAAAAGYGYSTVEVNIDGVDFYNVRSASGGSSVTATICLEQVVRGSIDNCRIYSSGDYDVTPLDLYANVKNFNVTNFNIEVDNNGNAGGTWVRNFDGTNATENINFSNGRFYSTASDELLAIWPPDDTRTVKNVNVNNVQFYVDTGATTTHIITVLCSNAGSTCKDVNFSNIQVETAVDVTSVIWVYKDSGTVGTLENVNVSNVIIRTRSDMTSNNCFGIRYADNVDNVIIYVTAIANFTYGYFAFNLCDRINNSKVSYASADFATNNYTKIASLYNNNEVSNCDIEGHVYGNRKVIGCKLTDGFITGNRKLLYNDINISNDLGTTLINVHHKEYDSYWIVGNTITETFDSDTTDALFYTVTYGPTHIVDNYYTGDRERFFLNNTSYDVVECRGNVIDADGSGRMTAELIIAAGTATPCIPVTNLDSTAGAMAVTLAAGQSFGMIKTFVMSADGGDVTLTIANHQTSDPEVATFDAVDETGVFMWTGTEWITIFATCTF